MASSSTPQRVTFGVELEMLVPYLIDQPDPAKDVDTRQVIRLSGNEMYGDAISVADILAGYLHTQGVAMSSGYEPQEDSLPTTWSISRDSPVKETKFKPYSWVGLELRSPALLAQEESFAQVKRVVSLLRGNYRLRINSTTGFHVHVGLGNDMLPSRAILRLTKLLWCAEGMLSQLHPPERMLSAYSQSLRHESYLAQGKSDDPFWREETGNPTTGGGLTDDSAALRSRPTAFQHQPGSSPALDAWSPGSSRAQRLPPVRTNPYEDVGARRRYRHPFTGARMETKTRKEFLRFFKLDEGEFECTPVLNGLITLSQPEIQHQPAVAVGKISIGSVIRANYDLKPFGKWRTGLNNPDRKTIEFRGAAGSLDPSWIVVWARIASRIVEFCLRAGDEEFLNVLVRVLEAELVYEAEGISRYDVIDYSTTLA